MNYINILEVIGYFLYSISMITLGISVNNRLYKNVKKEEHLEKGKIIQRIMKTHSLVQCIAWPCLIVMAFFLKLNKHLHLDFIPKPWVGYLIQIQRFSNSLNACYGGFNSLIMAISRYVCIVHHHAVDRYGVRKVRKFLIGSSIGIPFLLAILADALVPVENIWEMLFMPDIDLALNEHQNGNTSTHVKKMMKIPESPIYYITNTFLPPKIVSFFTLVWTASMFLIHSNLLEGIIYLHTYIYYKRSQNKISIKKGLSEDTRMRRQRRYTISIQMTVTSWSLELISGIITLINAFIFAHDTSKEISTQVLVAIHVFLYFVVIPGTYLLNTEVYKSQIFDKGWRTVLPNRKSRQRIAPEPIEQVEMNVVRHAPLRKRETQPGSNSNKGKIEHATTSSIPTISGNINLETSYVVY